MQSSGFANAPATRTLLFALLTTSLLASVTDTKHFIPISVRPHFVPYAQFWRVLVWQVAWTNSVEVLFGVAVLYQVGRGVERMWGVRKFVSFLIVSFLYTTFISPLLLALIMRPLSLGYINHLPAGPTALIFALLAQYHAAVPYEYKYRVSASSSSASSSPSAINLTSKSTTYLLPAQLALSQLPGSAVVALVGWVVGYAYRMDLLPGGALAWRVPVRKGGRKERERMEGLRRRMEGEAATIGGGGRASGVEASTRENAAGRRGLGGQILDQFRGGN